MLTIRESMALELAAQRFKFEGARETRVLDELGMTITRFHQVVGALLDRPDAWAAYPVDVARLRRLRDQRRAARDNRRAS